MKPTYNYDELYGTLIHKNKDDTERVYFCVDCEYWKFYRWMFVYGWNKARDHPCERNELKGYEVTLKR